MKLLIIHNSYRQPGGEDVVFEQERQMLQGEGHVVAVYRRSNWEPEAQSLLGQARLVPKVVWSSDARKEIAQLLHKHRPDLVHVHNTFFMISPSIYEACEEAGVPVVQTLHNYRLMCPAATFFRNGHVCEECMEHSLWNSVLHGCYRGSRPATAVVAIMLAIHRQLRTYARKNQSFIALTEFSRSKFIQGGLPGSRIFVKPNFVHPDPGLGSGNREYAVFVGRLSPEKRVSTLLQAWQRLPERIPLLIIGGGPERPHLESDAKRQDIEGIYFQGPLPRNHTIAAIQNARFLVFPSEWYENFPVTIVEAFASGTPVLASRLGAMREIIEDGRTGLFFEPGNPDDLARTVAWAWSHRYHLDQMGRQVRREYETKYTAAVNYRQLMSIYGSILSPQTAEMPVHQDDIQPVVRPS
jgi:glycosyltransferase involved in cell wall biosynthesis